MSIVNKPLPLDKRTPYAYKIRWADGKETTGTLMLSQDVAMSLQLELAVIKAVGESIGHDVSPLAEDTLVEFAKMR